MNVEVEVQTDVRLPQRVEVTAYYVVSEALANAAKHANASVVHVAVDAAGPVIWLSVSDDGADGADPARGSGLIGLKDRVEAIGGRFALHSPPGAGTTVQITLPLYVCSAAPLHHAARRIIESAADRSGNEV